ncbi:primosomal protein N' [bacterium]|nr:primosomal protein N' [bacterium]
MSAKIAVAGPAVDGVFDYSIPPDTEITEGSVALVPFRRQKLAGIVMGFGEADIAPEKVKPLLGVFPCPPVSLAMRRFLAFMAAYTMQPLGSVVKLALTPGEALELPKRASKNLLPQQQGGMVARPELSADQREAVGELEKAVATGKFGVHLLDGVTGSGKTEVYFRAIETAMAAGKQVLVLLPEIGLSTQWMARWEMRFGFAPVVWHSDVGMAVKKQAWRGVASGEVKLVVGARSAMFLPFKRLGLVVVDEEHDGSFKQEEGVIYHARDMAIARAKEEGCPIVLASATPSLETLSHAESGKYQLLPLPERHGGATLPDVMLIDNRKTPAPRGDWLSPPLREAITQRLAKGEQSLLFLNRRGYAPLVLCRGCGHRLECPHCSAWLVMHAGKYPHIQCHHCGHKAPVPKTCPECQAEDKFAACGPGVERLEEEVARLWPMARMAAMTSDHIEHPEQAAKLIGELEEGKVDILIGTQMAAKGFHFPNLTLVGVVDGDMSLSGADPRAAERSFQLMHQVGGRAGREAKKGLVMIQTHQPEHPLFQALKAHDRDGFYQQEAAMRKDAGIPPYGRLAAVIIAGPDEAKLVKLTREMAAKARFAAPVRLLGPAPAPIYRLRGQYRMRFLLQGPANAKLQPALAQWLHGCAVPSSVQVKVDIDPIAFM